MDILFYLFSGLTSGITDIFMKMRITILGAAKQ